jgi:hypothetical protein
MHGWSSCRPPAGIPLDVLAFSGLRGKGLLHTADRRNLRLLKAFWDCGAHPAPARRRARCSAWAAMSAFPAA